jgi:hypothetical protein
MITKEQLVELNKMKCSEHNETPKAQFLGEDINFEYCCDNFSQEIKDFVREQTIKNMQDITRQSFGLK